MHIINDILDYTLTEAGKMSIENKTFNLKEAINEILLLLNITADQKKLVLNCHDDMNVPELLNGDIVRLRQIISNLVGNAIKFTKHGSIELKIEILDRTSSNVKLLFSVADTGIGISEEQQKLLFGNFVQLDSTYSKNYQGTGLGLAISKKLVELMNGEIWCESELGFGSTFYFSLDLAVHTDKRSDRNEVPDNYDRELSFRQKKVLIAYDDRISREIIVKLLEKRGVYVLTASDGRQAVEIFRKEKLDLVLLDVQMPEFNGISTVRAIRGIEVGTGTHTPVIAFTAYVQMLDKEELLKAGMDDYLGKPIEIRE